MRFLIKIAEYIVASLVIFILHIISINFLFYPLNHINLLIIAILWLIISNFRLNIVIIGFIISYFSELLSGAPFGILMVSTVLSVILIRWLLLNLFTNRSIYMVFLAALLSLIVYRIFFFLLLATRNFFVPDAIWPTTEIIIDIGWELLLSPIALALIYLIGSVFFRKLNPGYIESGKEVIFRRDY